MFAMPSGKKPRRRSATPARAPRSAPTAARTPPRRSGKPVTPKHGTLAWMAHTLFERGARAAQTVLEQAVPDQSQRDFHLVPADFGQPASRNDVPDESIDYQSFNPPALWGAPYTLLRATFPTSKPRDGYMYHGGEELLVPTSGAVMYHFFWTPGGERPRRHVLDSPVGPGEIIRINPQIPHHTWAAGPGPATAWMVFRHISHSPSAISVNPQISTKDVRATPREFTGERLAELTNPAVYALTAMGISEQTRVARDGAQLSVRQFAALSDVDAAQLTRLEAALKEGNVSLDALVRIGRLLRLPLPQLFQQALWNYERGSVALPHSDSAALTAMLAAPRGLPHLMHPRVLSARAGWSGVPAGIESQGVGAMITWIALEGSVIVRVRVGDRTPEAILSAGGVLHWRDGTIDRVEVREDCRILQITCGTNCSCRPALGDTR
jgi:hypothetical protein